jgi:hypothetical protein
MISIGTGRAYATTSSCTATLDGFQEVPPVDTDGTGSATITFDSSSNQLSWSIQFSGLSGPAIAAHFHGPALVGVDAGVLVDIGAISGLSSPLNGSAVLTLEQASSLLAGRIYVNIHTESNPDGEIRGQISCEQADQEFQDTFNLDDCELSPTGANDYFFLQPGYQLVLQGQEDGNNIELTITVLNDTEIVDGVDTRVVEEKETENGQLIEISRNYFSICAQTGDIYYFGEAVDIYEDGEIVSNEGAWLAGQADARAGLIIPANPEVGMRYYQEVALGIAEDRAEIISRDEFLVTPAGSFNNVVKVEETTPLEPGVKEYKFHAPEVGLIQDGPLKLVRFVLPEVEGPVELELKPLLLTVSVAGTSIQVDLNSSSTISEFTLDEENKRITFKADGENGTAGKTEIAIGRVLEGPYTVTIDGQVTSNVEVTQAAATGESIIKISYTHSTHDIAVTGTNVVPEFPISAIGLAAGILVAAILIGRSSLAGDFRRWRTR